MTVARVGVQFIEAPTSAGSTSARTAVQFIEAATHPGSIPARVAVQFIEIVVKDDLSLVWGWPMG